MEDQETYSSRTDGEIWSDIIRQMPANGTDDRLRDSAVTDDGRGSTGEGRQTHPDTSGRYHRRAKIHNGVQAMA